MQALESLNDSQVNDFLSGKTPLNLSMRLGDHMMLIQLQLSTVNPTTSPTHVTRTRSVFKTKMSTSSSQPSSNNAHVLSNANSTTTLQNTCEMSTSNNRMSRSNSIEMDNSLMSNSSTSNTTPVSTSEHNTDGSASNQRDMVLIENLKSIVNSLTNIQNNDESNFDSESLLEQSPIKSLSNLVSSPIKTTPIKTIPISTFSPSSSSATSNNSIFQSDPISAKLTSCLCKRFDTNSNSCDINCQLRQDVLASPSTSSSSSTQEAAALPSSSQVSSRYLSTDSTPEMKLNRSSLLHRTTNNPILKIKRRHTGTCNGFNLRRSKSSDNLETTLDGELSSTIDTAECNQQNTTSPPDSPETVITGMGGTDTRALAEASRNLTKTLRKLSKEVFTNKVDVSEDNQRKSAGGSGAVMESMKNHGKGIYSGTFSGTLNPALQDRYGRPKRDISTVIHILNDLLSATPQYSRGARISFEPTGSRSIKQVSNHFGIFTKIITIVVFLLESNSDLIAPLHLRYMIAGIVRH